MDKYVQTTCDHCKETYAARNARAIIGYKEVSFICPLCFLKYKDYGKMREQQRECARRFCDGKIK